MCPNIKPPPPPRWSSSARLATTIILICIFNQLQSIKQATGEASRSLVFFQPETTTAAAAAAATTITTTATEPPDFQEAIGNHTVPVGKDVQFSCRINHLGVYRTAWLRVEDKGILTIHNNIITRNYRIGLLNNDNGREFVLTIKNVQPSDKGGYMCQINSIPMRYAIGYLDVLTPPAFDEPTPAGSFAASTATATTTTTSYDQQQMADQQQQPAQASQVTVGEASNASLSCKAHGHPTPTITWRREDGQPILLNGLDYQPAAGDYEPSTGGSSSSSSSSGSVEGSQLVFSSVHRLNSGAYLCIASNGVQPSASRRIVLDVQFRPVVTLPETEVAAVLGQVEARLECLVDLNPLGSYHWVKLSANTAGQPTTMTTTTTTTSSGQEDDLWLIEHDELMQSDKYEIVIKQMTSERVQMILNIRSLEKRDFAHYKCIGRNALGLQSNTIRLYESSSSSSSSSFSLNNMFRGGGGGVRGNSIASQQDGQEPQSSSSSSGDLQMNDETARSRPQVLANQQRPQTRASWIQRSSGSSVRQVSGANNNNNNNHHHHQASSSACPTHPVHANAALLLLLSSTCLLLNSLVGGLNCWRRAHEANLFK